MWSSVWERGYHTSLLRRTTLMSSNAFHAKYSLYFHAMFSIRLLGHILRVVSSFFCEQQMFTGKSEKIVQSPPSNWKFLSVRASFNIKTWGTFAPLSYICPSSYSILQCFAPRQLMIPSFILICQKVIQITKYALKMNSLAKCIDYH